MADSAVSFLLDHLSIWLQEEGTLLGLKAEAQLIHDELKQTREFLKVADAREESNPLVKGWAKQMREIAYDTEDVLENYMLRFGGHASHGHGIYGRIKKIYASIKNLKAKHYMASEIKTLRSRAKNASETFKSLLEGLAAGSSSSVSAGNAGYDGRADALLLEEAEVVGIHVPKRKLLDWISTSKNTRRVVSVVGMGGLDKTTLVKKVYEDPSLCEGLPLAIVVIGGVLARKTNEIEEWRKFDDNLASELEVDKRMQKVLSLSYYDLPYYLKACLLYLSNFPKNHLLEKATIIHLWAAEGFVKTNEGKTIEEIVYSYLNELCHRSIVQIAEETNDGRPKKYRIHDFVREYIISKAREQSLVAVKNKRGIAWDYRIRGLTLDDSVCNHIKQTNNYKCLRTLLIFGSSNLEWGSILCNILLHGGYRMLKELDLRGAPLGAIPNEVFKLYQLKYLCLRDTNVSFVPKLIGNLEKLETLDLKGCQVVELPIEILKLQRLQYLSVYRYDDSPHPYNKFDNVQCFKAPYEIGQLRRLQKLCYIDASANMQVKQIGKLEHLRRLCIVKLRKEDGKDLCYSLANIHYITSLAIFSLEEGEVIDLDYDMLSTPLEYIRCLHLKGRLEKVPQWIPSLRELTTLRLRWSKMVEDPMECLQDLPSLQILSLVCAYEGEGLSFKSGGFRMLKKLYMESLRGLKWMRVEKGSILSLKELIFLDCKAMREVPMGVEHLSQLEFVDFSDMAEELVEKLIKEKKRNGDHWKLAHVPSIVIGKWDAGKWNLRWL